MSRLPWLWHGLGASAAMTAALAAVTAIDVSQLPGDLYLLKELGYRNGYGPLHNALVHAAGAPGDFNATYPLLIVASVVVLSWGLHRHDAAWLVYVCLPAAYFPLRYGHFEELAITGFALAAAARPAQASPHMAALALKPTAAAYAGASLRHRPLLVTAALAASGIHTAVAHLPRAGIPNGEELWTLPLHDGLATTALRASWVAAALVIGALWHSTTPERLKALTAIAILRAGSEITVFAYYLTPAAIFGLVVVHLAIRPAATSDSL